VLLARLGTVLGRLCVLAVLVLQRDQISGGEEALVACGAVEGGGGLVRGGQRGLARLARLDALCAARGPRDAARLVEGEVLGGELHVALAGLGLALLVHRKGLVGGDALGLDDLRLLCLLHLEALAGVVAGVGLGLAHAVLLLQLLHVVLGGEHLLAAAGDAVARVHRLVLDALGALGALGLDLVGGDELGAAVAVALHVAVEALLVEHRRGLHEGCRSRRRVAATSHRQLNGGVSRRAKVQRAHHSVGLLPRLDVARRRNGGAGRGRRGDDGLLLAHGSCGRRGLDGHQRGHPVHCLILRGEDDTVLHAQRQHPRHARHLEHGGLVEGVVALKAPHGCQLVADVLCHGGQDSGDLGADHAGGEVARVIENPNGLDDLGSGRVGNGHFCLLRVLFLLIAI